MSPALDESLTIWLARRCFEGGSANALRRLLALLEREAA